MKNKDILKAIKFWQTNTKLHPATCSCHGKENIEVYGVKSHHQLLEGVIIDKEVVLKCPKCNNTQRGYILSLICDLYNTQKTIDKLQDKYND